MREYRAAGGSDQPRIEAGIALATMSGIGRGCSRPATGSASRAASGGRPDGGHIAADCHRRPMRRIINAVVALPQLVEAPHVGRHVAVGRDDDRRRPAHHMIAGEQGAAIGEAQMVRGMAGRRHRSRAACRRPRSVRRPQAPDRAHNRRRTTRRRGDPRLQRERRAADDRRAGRFGSGRAAGLWSRWVWVHMIAATGRPAIACSSASRCSGRSGPGSITATSLSPTR